MMSGSTVRKNTDSDAFLPTKFGDFRIRSFVDPVLKKEHALLYIGEPNLSTPLVRVHSECLTGDAFGSLRCDCGAQLEEAMREVQRRGNGAIVYLRQEGRGIGLFAKIQAYKLQDSGSDTLDANLELGYSGDQRTYDFAAKMLLSIGMNEIDLLTNNPDKCQQLRNNGISINSRVPIIVGTCEYNRSYLMTKASRMGHIISV
jgi:3,4-dihydroxy 2-butanone 4-phosphate synthase/GTP cyclohydrolase II|tara:strand:- start:121 stop:726 length:606 start_codon:yes stop_codon:yes gene_type:complete